MQKPPGAIRLRPHSFEVLRTKHRVLPWPVCKHCGLVALKNKATQLETRKGCWLWEDEGK